MRFRTVLLLFIAVGLAGGTAMLARAWLAAQRAAEIAEAAPLALPTPAKSVLVAGGDIRRGQILKPEDMMWQGLPGGGIHKSYAGLGTPPPPPFLPSVPPPTPWPGGSTPVRARAANRSRRRRSPPPPIAASSLPFCALGCGRSRCP